LSWPSSSLCIGESSSATLGDTPDPAAIVALGLPVVDLGPGEGAVSTCVGVTQPDRVVDKERVDARVTKVKSVKVAPQLLFICSHIPRAGRQRWIELCPMYGFRPHTARLCSPSVADANTANPEAAPPPSTDTQGSKRRATPQCCFAWNQGECRYPRCRYRHACLHCGGDHPMLRRTTLWDEEESRPGRDTKVQRETRRL
jgi:hypothetical protein